jgi:hypothetical protein
VPVIVYDIGDLLGKLLGSALGRFVLQTQWQWHECYRASYSMQFHLFLCNLVVLDTVFVLLSIT